MALASIDFKITFDVVNHRFKITDTSTYAGQGVALSSVAGSISATDPMGNAYAQTITPNSSLDSGNISPVLDTNGDFVLGNYTVQYTVVQASTGTTIVLSKTFNFTYISPEVSISMTFDSTLPLLRSLDDTSYTVDGVTPSITRTHTLKYPNALVPAIADLVVATALLETSANLYTMPTSGLQHTALISSVLSYTVASDYIITDTVTGESIINVFADDNLCAVYCCIKGLWTKYDNALCNNKTKAQEYLDQLLKVTIAAGLMRQAALCGKAEDITTYYQKILTIAECDGCECGSDEPILVTGIGYSAGSGGNTYVVVNTDTAISITSATVSTTTTFTVNLLPALLTKLNALRNVYLENGIGTSIDTSTDVNGDIHYKVNVLGASDPNNFMAFDIIIDNSSIGAIPTLSIDNVVTSGTQFTGAPTVTWKSLLDAAGDGILTDVGATSSEYIFQYTPVKILIANIFNVAPTVEYPKIFSSIKRAYSNNRSSSVAGNEFSNSFALNMVSNRLNVSCDYFTASSNNAALSFRYINNPGLMGLTLDTGNIFFRHVSSPPNPFNVGPQLYTEISVLILL